MDWSVVFFLLLPTLFASISPAQGLLSQEEMVFQDLNTLDTRFDIRTPRRNYGFCKLAMQKNVLYAWSRSYIEFLNVDDVDVMYTAESEEEVLEGLQKWFPSKYLQFSLFRSNQLNVPLYTNFCMAVQPKEPTSFYLRFEQFSLRNLLLLTFGLIAFYSASFLSRQFYIYYMGTVSIGVFGFLVLLCFILMRFLPRRFKMLAVLFSFTANTFFVVDKLKTFIITYPYNLYLGVYVLITGVLSFAYAYYHGPKLSARTLDLVRWTIQLIGLASIFFSSEHYEIILLIIFLILVQYNYPRHFVNSLCKKVSSVVCKPRARRLLTQKEYKEQGERETRKALEELRKFCNSPECRKWETIKKLKDPKRFASFVDGQDHINFSEITTFEVEQCQMTEDESDE